MKTKISIKPYFRMSEGKLLRLIMAYYSGVIDINDPDLCLLYVLQPKVEYLVRGYRNDGNFDSNEALIAIYVAVMSKLFIESRDDDCNIIDVQLREDSPALRLKIVDGATCRHQTNAYTPASLLFDIIDLAKDYPTVINFIAADCLSPFVKARIEEIEKGLTDRSGEPAPQQIVETIRKSVRYADNLVKSKAYNFNNLRNVKVTHLAPGYTWASWVDFK